MKTENRTSARGAALVVRFFMVNRSRLQPPPQKLLAQRPLRGYAF